MRRGDFEFVIASTPDREKVICEIYYQNELIGEISQETSELLLEIYPSTVQKWWAIPLFQFQTALEEAKTHLLGKNQN
jgi:hypothetical protein